MRETSSLPSVAPAAENILRGVAAATVKGCHIVTMSGFAPDDPLRRTRYVNFYVP